VSNQTIAEQVVGLQEAAAARLPAEVLDRFAEDQRDLDSAGLPADMATPGTSMPDGDLLDAHGKPTTLADVTDGKPAVIVFYRGAWCPYCNVALRTYQEQLVPALTERGAKLVALSPQKPDGSLSMRETNELTFAVLSDPGNQVAGKLGILIMPSEGTREAQQKLGLDVSAANADGTHALPMPTTIVVDAGGVIRWIDVHPNYTTRSEVSDILAAVDKL
jgi:peroxiredoxin